MIDEDRIKEIAQDAAGVYDCCAFANPAFIEDAILKALSEERAQRAEVVPLDKIVHIDRGFSGVGGDADATPKVTVLFAAGDWFGRDAFARAIGYQRSDMNNGEGKK